MIASNFFPAPDGKKISLWISPEYDYYPELLEVIIPVLASNGYTLLNLSEDRRVIDIAYSCFGCDIRQQKYLVESAELNICEEKHWSALFAKRSVFVSRDLPVEKNCQNILDVLGLDRKISIKTILVGDSYGHKSIEVIPDFDFPDAATLPRGVPLNIRCDVIENWDFVVKCVNQGYSPIVSCVTPPPKQISGFLTRIKKMNVLVNTSTDKKSVDVLDSAGINYSLILEEDCPETKLNLFDCKDIRVISPWYKKHLDIIKLMPYDAHLKSTRDLISGDGSFMSVYHWRHSLKMGTRLGDVIGDGAENEEFLKEADLFYYYQNGN